MNIVCVCVCLLRFIAWCDLNRLFHSAITVFDIFECYPNVLYVYFLSDIVFRSRLVITVFMICYHYTYTYYTVHLRVSYVIFSYNGLSVLQGVYCIIMLLFNMSHLRKFDLHWTGIYWITLFACTLSKNYQITTYREKERLYCNIWAQILLSWGRMIHLKNITLLKLWDSDIRYIKPLQTNPH